MKAKIWEVFKKQYETKRKSVLIVRRLVRLYKNKRVKHYFKRYFRQSSIETQLKDKSKIEGAYLLLKRYKNRLKDLDNALQKFDQKKADVTALEQLADATKHGRALEVFNDMKILFDTTISNFHES